MRKILLLLLLVSCSSKEKSEPPPSPGVEDEKAKRIAYEGIIKIKHRECLVELYLVETEPGLTSSFEIRGYLIDDQILNWTGGEYSILHGAKGNEVILKLHGKTYFSRIGKKPDPKKPMTSFKPEIYDLDLFFITEGGNKLVLVDEDFDRIADDNRYTLYRRSRLFTAEGYITYDERRKEFFEANTMEDWIVAPLGEYRKTKHNYDSIATEEFEGVYLKALAYSVQSDSSDKELLVIKSILEMKKSDAYTNKEKAARLTH